MKKGIAVLLAALMLAGVWLVGCGERNPDELWAAAKENIVTTKSARLHMTMDMAFDLQGETTSMTMKMDEACTQDPLSAEVNMTMDMGGLGKMDTTMYLVQEDGEYVNYMKMSGGILGAQGLLTVLGKGKKMQNVALIAALVTLVVGGICVFMHLQHWERIFNAFGALLAGNGYGVSGITLELWGCVIEFIAIVLFFLFARRAEDGVAPKWVGVLAIIVGLALPMVTGDSYLMPSLPTWDTPLLIVYYLTNTIFMGGLAALVIAGVTGDTESRDFMVKTALVGAVAQLVVVLVYVFIINGSAGTYSADISFCSSLLPITSRQTPSSRSRSDSFKMHSWIASFN